MGLQQAHDLGVIYITHDLSSVRHFSERIFVMYAAKIIEKAAVRELDTQSSSSLHKGVARGDSRPRCRKRFHPQSCASGRASESCAAALRMPVSSALSGIHEGIV